MAHLVFIHGIANKPESDELLRIWQRVLARDEGDDPGVNLATKGIHSSLIYWADVMYGEPDPDISKFEREGEEEPRGLPGNVETGWRDGVDGADEKQWQSAFERIYGIDPNEPNADEPLEELRDELERIPLPWIIKRPFMKLLARDTHHYLFNTEHSPRPGLNFKVRDEIRSRFVAGLQEAKNDGGPLIVMAHSQGTIVTYDCLKNIPECPEIDGLITLGSPLGLDEVQDKLAPGHSKEDGFPSDKLKGAWRNIYDPLDIVSRADPKLANDYRQAGRNVVTDHVQTNSGAWRHAMTKYLAGTQVRNATRIAFGLPDPNAKGS